jgi:hypothetical protein
MATFVKLPSGSWRAVVRRKGRYISETFLQREDARRWATGDEHDIDRGDIPKDSVVARKTSLADLIDLHIADMRAINKSIGRTKYDMLTMLKNDAIGCVRFSDSDRLAIINFARRRARRGAVTVRMYIGAIKLVLISAAALHGLATMPDQVDVARDAPV